MKMLLPLAIALTPTLALAEEPPPANRAPAAATTPAETRAERQRRLRVLLQLRPAQEADLSAYLDTVEDTGRRMHSMAAPLPPTMPERVRRMQAVMDAGKQAIDRLAASTIRLYDSLDASQKAAFDALPLQAVMHGDRSSLGMADGVLTGLDPLQR